MYNQTIKFILKTFFMNLKRNFINEGSFRIFLEGLCKGLAIKAALK